MNQETTPSILFLCTGNSCRSQMAEGLCRERFGQQFAIYSAGIEAHGINPFAVTAMAEIGIDISTHKSQTLAQLDRDTFDIVVTVCSHADRHCPLLEARLKRIHKGFDDPPKLAANETSDEARLAHYRRGRDEIDVFLQEFCPTLKF